MDLSGIKLVVTDMDGTLLNSNHEVSPLFFDLFKVIRQRGILFAAASGRQFNSIEEKLAPIREDIIIIAENGGFARHKGKELLSTPLPWEVRREALQVLSGIDDIYPVLCGKEKAYIETRSPFFIGKLSEYYTDFEILEALEAFPGEIMKIAVYHQESSETYIYPHVKQFEGDLKVKVSGANWVDLSHRDAHKGFALKKIQEQYGILPSETLVFGDYNNDLEMMALSEFSVAMENAHPNVLEAARYRTASNDAQGVEQVLRKLVGQD